MISTFQADRKFRVAVVGGDGRGANLDWPVGYTVRMFAGSRFGGNGEKRRLRDALSAQNIDGIIWLARWNGHDQRFLRDAQVPHRVWEKGMSELAKELPDIFPIPPWTEPEKQSEIDWTQASQDQEVNVVPQEQVVAGGSVVEKASSKDTDDALSLAAEMSKGDADVFLRSVRDLGVNVPVGDVIVRLGQLPREREVGVDMDLLGRHLQKYLPKLGAEWVSPRMARRLSGCSVKGIANLVADGVIRRDVDPRGNRYHRDDCVKVKHKPPVESEVRPEASPVDGTKTNAEAVLEVLRARAGKPVRVTSIIKISGRSRGSLSQALYTLARQGKIESVKRGYYRLVGDVAVPTKATSHDDDQWVSAREVMKILGLSKGRISRIGLQHNNGYKKKRLYFLPDVLKRAEQRKVSVRLPPEAKEQPVESKEPVRRTDKKVDGVLSSIQEVVELEARAVDLGVHDAATAVKIVLAFVQKQGSKASTSLWTALVRGVRG